MADKHKNLTVLRTRFLLGVRGVFGMNIGTVMFGILLIYMMISAGLYMISNHIESYEVISAPLSRNETYTGLAIREEKVYKADVNGYVIYYAREGDKINANGAVFGVCSTKSPESQAELTSEDLANIRKEMLGFSKSFNSNNFNATYSFKYILKGNILQYAGVTQQAMDEEDDGTSSVTFGNQTISKAQSDGIVLYSKDGYEGKTLETLTLADFDQNSYHETDLKTEDAVKIGDEIYTIISDERWSVLIPLSDKQAVKLSDRKSIRVKFLKDGMTQTGDFSIVEIENRKYGKIDFNKGLIRYASDRFLEIELVTNNVVGLKIPLKSIVTKEFYLIPAEYSITNNESSEVGFMIEKRGSNGKTENVFVNAKIFATEEIAGKVSMNSDDIPEKRYQYYVEKSSLKKGDILTNAAGTSKFVVGDVGALEGVYCINKGYAAFRRIQVLDQNEEYAIISKNTTYGLARYDHIVKNADKVHEEDVVY